MGTAELSEALVEGHGDDIVVMVAGYEHSVEERIQIKSGAHTTQFEVAQPQLGVGECSFLAKDVEFVHRGILVFSHRVPDSA